MWYWKVPGLTSRRYFSTCNAACRDLNDKYFQRAFHTRQLAHARLIQIPEYDNPGASKYINIGVDVRATMSAAAQAYPSIAKSFGTPMLESLTDEFNRIAQEYQPINKQQFLKRFTINTTGVRKSSL